MVLGSTLIAGVCEAAIPVNPHKRNKNLRFFADSAAKEWPCGQRKAGVKEVRSQNLDARHRMCLAAKHARPFE
jgi:hypothetical protein